jgi:hypothetical protein
MFVRGRAQRKTLQNLKFFRPLLSSHLRIQVAWQNEAIDPLVSHDADGMIE